MATGLGVAQLVMALVGLGLICVGTVSLSRWWEIRSPLPALAGLMLLLPVPVYEGLVSLDEAGAFTGRRAKSAKGASGESLLEQEETNRRNASRRAQNLLLLSTTVAGSCLVASLMLLGIGVRRRFEESVLTGPTTTIARVTSSPSAMFMPLATLGQQTALPTKVRRYQGRADHIPPQVEALGRAKHLYTPIPSLGRIREKPRALVYLGVAFLCAAVAMLIGFHDEPLPLACGVLTAVIGLVFFLAARYPLPPIPTYLVYREALLIVLKNDFVIVPWKAIAEFHPIHGITTREGERLRLNSRVRDWPQLVQKVREQVAVEQLPHAEQLVAAGMTAVFGPFEVNTAALSCERRTVPWDHVAQVTVKPEAHGPTVEIRTQDSLWCRQKLDFPNDFIFLEMLKRLCRPTALITGT